MPEASNRDKEKLLVEAKTRHKEKLPGSANLFVRPRPVKSGQPFKQRVVISHRSDNLLKEQV